MSIVDGPTLLNNWKDAISRSKKPYHKGGFVPLLPNDDSLNESCMQSQLCYLDTFCAMNLEKGRNLFSNIVSDLYRISQKERELKLVNFVTFMNQLVYEMNPGIDDLEEYQINCHW